MSYTTKNKIIKYGFTVATGSPVGLGQTQVLNVTFQSTTDTDIETSNVITGEYLGIAIVPYHATVNVAGSGMQTLYSNIGSHDLDNLLGQMLYGIGVSYFSHLDFEQALYGKNLQVISIKQPSEALVSADVIPTYLFGTVSKVDEGGVSIDVKRDIDIPLPIDGNTGRSIDYMNVSGLGSSSWESSILGGFFSVPTVSAVKLLNAAYKQGIPIYTITSGNINSIIPQLNVDPQVISAIQDAINMGDEVIISQTNIQYYDWDGVGYIVYDPATGAGGYMISGGLMGGGTAEGPPAINQCPFCNPPFCPLVIEERYLIYVNAVLLVGTLAYGYGGQKAPYQKAIDCSGLVSYVYSMAGITVLGQPPPFFPMNADDQHNYVVSINGITTNPQLMDLVFFSGTCTTPCPGRIITHIGLYVDNNTYIASQGSRGVDFYQFNNWANQHLYSNGPYGSVFPPECVGPWP